MTQIIATNNGGGKGGGGGEGDMLKSVYDPQNIGKDAFDYDNFTNTPTIPVVPTEVSAFDNDAGYITSSDLPDLSGYQLKSNLVTNLTSPDDTHYPSAKAVSDAITSAGGGDMLKATYDPNNIGKDAFDYDNFINTPTIPAAQIQSDWNEADNTKADYIKNKPTIPAAQVNSDWNANSGVAQILNKPTIPTVNNPTITIQKNGTKVEDFTLNQSSGETINITVPTKVSDLSNDSGFITGIDSGDVTTALGYTPANDTDVVKTTGNQTINGTKTFGTSPVVPSKTTAATNTGTAIATEAQVYTVQGGVDTINGKISSAASSSNKLVDKNYVDDSINSVTAYYITKNAAGDQFATYAELSAATTFYSGGVVRTPTRNDYTIVLADENHDNATTRYIYNSGWEYQYTVNETALTQQQVDALNSGITSAKVSSYDTAVSTIAGYGNIVTHNTSEFATSAQGGKADTALQPNDNISELNNDAGYITGVNWGNIGGTLSNQVDLQNALTAKANDNAVVHTSGAETINGTKTFGTSPVVPNKTANATNTGTAIATEAQVYKKQDSFTVGNGLSLNSGTLSAQLKVWTLPAIISPSDSVSAEIKAFADAGNVPVLKWELGPYYMYTGSTSGVYTFSMVGVDETTLDVTCVQRRMVYSGGTYTWDMDTSSLQQKLTASTGINISSNQISNTLPFNPGGTATTGYVLKKTADGYGWDAESGAVTSVNGQTGAVTVSEFSPSGTATTGYVVTKTANGYEWKEPTGGISLDSNSPITVSKLWVGTEQQYAALSSYSNDTIYMTV